MDPTMMTTLRCLEKRVDSLLSKMTFEREDRNRRAGINDFTRAQYPRLGIHFPSTSDGTGQVHSDALERSQTISS